MGMECLATTQCIVLTVVKVRIATAVRQGGFAGTAGLCNKQTKGLQQNVPGVTNDNNRH